MVKASPKHVKVRMYNVGFGDAFLLIFPDGSKRPRRVLIDCGSHFQGAGPHPMKEVVAHIIEDVTDQDGVPRIDLVVGTHRHQDHVSGFELKDWANVEVGEVWMTWTEDKTDPEARKIREKQSKKASHLAAALRAATSDRAKLAFALADNALTNFEAMKTLHQGFKKPAPRHFYPTKTGAAVLEPPFLPGVRVHVLGPTRDPDVIRDMDPPEGESYLRLGATVLEGQAEAPPFTKEWEVAEGDLDEADRKSVADLGEIDPLAVAVSLEKAVNGTSLVLAFEIGDALMLFPGDAQWGTWKAMLDNPDVVELLDRITFLKVGHHGSHNATPVDFVEGLGAAREALAHPPNLWAMVSTRTMEMWPEIPRGPLMDALGGVTKRLARSDKTDQPKPTGFTNFDDHVVEAKVPFA